MQAQLNALVQVIVADYNRTCVNDDMKRHFADSIAIKSGRKYIKIVADSSVWGFIVNTDADSRFRRGDILKAASWAAPARNSARGNILDGGYTVRWTGPNYLV